VVSFGAAMSVAIVVSPYRFHNCCSPKQKVFTWFSLEENHTSRSIRSHGHGETG
jgi:hypothetical protein